MAMPLASQAGNVLITGVSATASTVTFTISMQYSWNITATAGSALNWDAVWCFVKYNDCASGIPNWQHLVLSSANVHTVTGGSGVLQADPVTDGMGVFIRRTNPGSNTSTPITGNVVLTFASALPSANYQFKVFGIEMAACPANDFVVGDACSQNRFNSYTITATMENTTGIPTASATLGGTGTLAGTLPVAYPVGYNAFYCMKYPMTTLELLDFLNVLSYDQQAAHLLAGAPNNAVGASVGNSTPLVTISASGNAATVPKTPATFASSTNLAYIVKSWNFKTYLAYLDWAGMRPMTEMEFEKACRGTLGSIPCEYAWGNNSGMGGGPSATSTRQTAGAAYYGMLDMSYNGCCDGNNSEETGIVNTTSQATAGGSAFTGALGNGALTAAGLADAANWPDATNASGGARK